MQTHKGNILDLVGKVDAICIPTNGVVGSKLNRAVMGAGLAYQVALRYPEAPNHLGQCIKEYGHTLLPFMEDKGTVFVSVPTKPVSLILEHEFQLDWVMPHVKGKFKLGDTVPGFWVKSMKGMVFDSLKQIHAQHENKTIAIPALGTGCGLFPKEEFEEMFASFFEDLPNIIYVDYT